MNELTIWQKQAVDFGTETEIFVDDPVLVREAAGQGTELKLSDRPISDAGFEDIIEEKYDPKVEEIDRLDYAVAAASGVIAAALDILWLDKFNIEQAAQFGTEKINKFIIKAARLVGYHGSSVDEAVKKIMMSAHPSRAGKPAGFSDFAQNGNYAGLCFSILSQFTGKIYGTDEGNNFAFYDIPDKGVLGENTPEKILNGVLTWVLAAGAKAAADPGSLKTRGVPGPIADLISELAGSPVLAGLASGSRRSRKTADPAEIYSLAAGIIGGSSFSLSKNGRFDLQKEMGSQFDIMKFSVSIIINECMVRGFYMLRRLMMEIRNKDIRSFSDLARLNPDSFMPYSNRVISRMLTVSSGTFVAVTTAKAAVVAARSSGGGWKASVIDFVTHINYGGLISFAFACKADGSYVAADIQESYREFLAWKRLKKAEEREMFESFGKLRLTGEQGRLLDSLKRCKLLYDIDAAKSLKELERKQAWLFAWEEDTALRLDCDREEYFIDDEDSIYAVINEKLEQERAREDGELLWIYIMAIELRIFAPYTGLESAPDTGGLLLRNDYETEVFCTRQDEVSAVRLEEMMNMMDSYVGILTSGEGQKNAGIAAAAVLTGGAALIPMAIAKAGGGNVDGAARRAVANINTGVIKGAEGIAGIFGNAGSAAFASGMSVPYECARILTVCEYVIKGMNDDRDSIANIRQYIYEQIVSIEGRLFTLKKDGRRLSANEKRHVSSAQTRLKYFARCYDLLGEML